MAIPSYLHWNPLIRWLMWKRYELISDRIKDTPDGVALEFGCGTGMFLPELTATCGTVYAIDLFPEYAKNLCGMLGLKVNFISSVDDLADASLDVIVAADVLEHLKDETLSAYLNLFSKKLKRDGRLIVSGPTENPIYRFGRVLAGFGDKGGYHHTNIDRLVHVITKHFELIGMRRLPFRFPPHLFKVCEFEQGQTD